VVAGDIYAEPEPNIRLTKECAKRDTASQGKCTRTVKIDTTFACDTSK